MKLPLEDTADDILAKAQRGLNRPSETDPRQLHLHPGALADIAAGRWYPHQPGPITGLVCLHT